MIKVSSSSFNGNEKKYVLDCLERGWVSQGKYVREFEERFANHVGGKFAISCSSGTAALHLAMLSLGVGPNDAVIVPALTYIATANAARYCGAEVIFCDVDERDWCLDADALAKIDVANYGRVFVIPVHLYDATFMRNLPENVLRVDDFCEDVGYRRRSCASAYSFFGSKIISCGEGGMLVTHDENVANQARLYRGQGATVPGHYHHSVVGHNYRMTDVQAAIGLAQLERLPENLTNRREIIDRYRDNLSGFHKVTLQGGTRASGWIMAVLVPENVNRESVRDHLLSTGIETRPFFDPIPSQPPYQSHIVPPVAANVARRGICLPTHTEMTVNDVDYICEKLAEAIQ